MKGHSEQSLTNPPKYPIKAVVVIGDITAIPLDKSIVKGLGITEQTFFQQEQSEEGIYLRIVKGTELPP